MYIKIEQEKKMEAVTHEIPEYSPIFLYSRRIGELEKTGGGGPPVSARQVTAP